MGVVAPGLAKRLHVDVDRDFLRDTGVAHDPHHEAVHRRAGDIIERPRGRRRRRRPYARPAQLSSLSIRPSGGRTLDRKLHGFFPLDEARRRPLESAGADRIVLQYHCGPRAGQGSAVLLCIERRCGRCRHRSIHLGLHRRGANGLRRRPEATPPVMSETTGPASIQTPFLRATLPTPGEGRRRRPLDPVRPFRSGQRHRRARARPAQQQHARRRARCRTPGCRPGAPIGDGMASEHQEDERGASGQPVEESDREGPATEPEQVDARAGRGAEPQVSVTVGRRLVVRRSRPWTRSPPRVRGGARGRPAGRGPADHPLQRRPPVRVIVSLNAITAPPAPRSASVWPAPQNAPRRHDRTSLRSRATSVETAAMWSASSACRRPGSEAEPEARLTSEASIRVLLFGRRQPPEGLDGDRPDRLTPSTGRGGQQAASGARAGLRCRSRG